LGAAVVFVGDLIPERLEQAKSFGCEPIDVTKGDPKEQIQELLGEPRSTRRLTPSGSRLAATEPTPITRPRRRC
jgi:threonine dehydrogenase-like Zn-dependent dehydrogenase